VPKLSILLTDLILIKKTESKKQYSLSITAICTVSGICFLFSSCVGAEIVAFILLLTVSVIAMFFDILPVLIAATLSALIWDYFFLYPRFNFSVGNTEDKIMLSMYFVIAVLNAVLTFKIKKIEKNARLKEEKEQALQLYNTLLHSLSHELKTPIATIVASTDNLLSTNTLISESNKKILLTEISKASLRLNQQVENLLHTSRLESGFIKVKKEWCDIQEIISTATSRLEEELKHFVKKIHCKEILPLFKIDYCLMEQVMYNLIENATKYTPEKSCIEISAIDIDNGLQIIVEDNGMGFPETETGKVFEKFYRLNNTRPRGTGLGLWIAKGFVEAHDGSIILQNKIPHGAKFTINIPAHKFFNS